MPGNLRLGVIGAFLLIATSTVEGSIMQKIEVDTISNTTELLERWNLFQSNFESTLESVLKRVFPLLVRFGTDADLSGECYDSLTKLIFAVRTLKPWALKMIDSIGKPGSGLLDGSLTAVGAYDQCMDIDVNSERKDGFRGQYCAVNLRPPLPPKPHFYRMDEELEALRNFTPSNVFVEEIKSQAASFYLVAIRIGVCVPSTCTADDVKNLGKSVADQLGFSVRVTDCHTKSKLIIETDQLVVICVVLAFVFTTISATIVHVYFYKETIDFRKNQKLGWQLIRSFSIPVNVFRLLDTKVNTEEAPLQCLHGIKFLSITWVLLGHTYLYVNWQSFSNLKNAQTYGQDLAFQTILNASVAVDTFFFISGFLLSYATIKLVDKHGRTAFNIPIYIGKRVWRLIPSALLTAGLMILVPIYGSGPFWHEVMDDLVSVCRRNWWAIALSVNNFLHPRQMCLQQTWYISCELQLYLCSLFMLWLLLKKRYYGFFAGAFMISLSIIAPGVVTYRFNHPPTMLLPNADIDQRLELFHNNYFLPYSHSGSYAMGVLLGYYLSKCERILIPRRVRILGWTLAVALCLSVLYSTVKFNRPSPATTAESVAYASLHRTGWSLGVTWLILVCTKGYGGVVNDILSWKALIPLSRLTYLVYLVHFIVIWSQAASLRSTVDARHAIGVWLWFGNLCISILISFLIKVFFESPLQELEKIVLLRLFGKKLLTEPSKTDGKINSVKGKCDVNGFESAGKCNNTRL